MDGVQETSDNLIDAAAQVFAERGYAEATTRSIAERAGVNEVTLFRRFGSKSDLMLAAFDRVAERFAPITAAPSEDVRSDLMRLATTYQTCVAENAVFLMTMLLEMRRRPELANGHDIQSRLIERASRLIRSHQDAGRLCAAPPPVLAAKLLAPFLLLALAEHIPAVHRMVIDIDEHVDRFLLGHGPDSANSS